MEIDPKKVKFRVRIYESEKQKAIVTIDFGGIVVKGYRIMESKYTGDHGEDLWVIPPSYNSKAGWRPIVHIPRKDIWKEIESAIVREYKREFQQYAEVKMNGVEF